MRKLYILSVIYLILPYLIFLITWLEPEIGIPFFTITIIGLIFNQKIFIKKNLTDRIQLNTKDHFFIGILAAFLCFFTGVEGTIPQVGDYWAHNSKLYTLYNYKWPIILPEVDTFLCYYWGTFLVPALFSKFSYQFLPLYSTLWTFIGCYLCVFWFYINLNKKGYLLFVFLCLGGLSRFIIYFFGDPETNFLFGILLNPNYLQLLIVPNQFIPAFLIVGIFVYAFANKINLYILMLPICSCFFWAVFPTLFLCFVYLFTILYSILFQNQKLSYKIIFLHIFIAFSFIPLIFYYQSSTSAGNLSFVFSIIVRLKTLKDIYQYFIFELSIFLVCFHLLKRSVNSKIKWHFIFILFFASISFSLFKAGRNNDLFLRTSMVTFIFFSYLIVYLIAENFKSVFQTPTYFIVLILVVHLYYFLGHINQNLTIALKNNISKNTKSAVKTPYNLYPNIYQTLKIKYSDDEAMQYLGNKNSIFYKFFIKKESNN